MLYQVNRGNKSRDFSVPAPILGLNKRDNLGAMAAQYAITMDNYMPIDNKIQLRPGYTEYYKFAKDSKVKTLVHYRKPNNDRFIALTDGKAYDVTSKAHVKQFAGVTFQNTRCQTVQYKNYLYFMNGIETPKVFYVDDEDAEHFENWNFSATGLLPSRIVAGTMSKEFLWFVEKNTLKAWYAEQAGNIAGKLNYFDLTQISKLGGELKAIINWTVDGGQGIDDYTVFLTSEGEALVYAGSNPNNAGDWELKGSYKLSKPIGYQCVMPYQGDVVIISEDGYIPMSKALALNNSGQSTLAFSDIIRGLVLDRTVNNKDREGWQSLIYTKKGYAIFNVPVSQQFEQHVVNINSGAWCRFTGLRAFCWGLYNGELYFGSDDAIYRFDDGYSDNGAPIEGKIEQAYNNLGTDNLKKIQLLNPHTRSSAGYRLTIYTNMDYEERSVNYSANVGDFGTTKWNATKWSSSKNPIGTKWGSLQAKKIRSQWIANSSTGFKASIVFKTKTKGNIIEWFDTGVRYELGSGIL